MANTDCITTTGNPTWESSACTPTGNKILDDIARHFGDVLCDSDCGELNDTDSPVISFTHPDSPTQWRNLEFRDNWEIIRVEGVDELADVQLTTSNNSFGDGVTVRSSRKVEKTVRILLRICPCEDECFADISKELYDILNCDWDAESPCLFCCGDNCGSDTLCWGDFAVKDGRYCEMRIECCGVLRALSVVRSGSMVITKEGGCYLFEFEYLAPSPYLYQPCLQSKLVEVLPEDLTGCPTEICGIVDFNNMEGFEKCITIPYTGNVDGRLIMTVTGPVTDLAMEITETGATFDFTRRGDALQFIECGAAKFNFLRGQQSYTNGNGESLYQDLSTGCTNQFVLDGCTEICITGKQVTPYETKIRFDWWNEFDGFFAGDPEVECVSACDQTDGCC